MKKDLSAQLGQEVEEFPSQSAYDSELTRLQHLKDPWEHHESRTLFTMSYELMRSRSEQLRGCLRVAAIV